MIGTVLPNSESPVELTYNPTREGTIKDHRLTCKITNGNMYTILLKAAAASPNVSLSWEAFDFGPCFVHTSGTTAPNVMLTMTNKDKQPLAVDCLFDNKEYLELDVSSFVLAPLEKRDIKIEFLPREVTAYSETITFSLNDLTSISITVRGEGTLPRVEVLNKHVRFGVCRIGDKKDVQVQVQCKSKIPTSFSLEQCLPAELAKQGIVVTPEQMVFLKPRETKPIIFSFHPQTRLRQFSGDMKMIVAGQELPFVSVTGSCQGAEVHLDNKQVHFGTVVVGTRVTKKVTIMNTGDIGLEYTWNEKKLAPDYTIVPATGYIAPHVEQLCELTYHPTEVGRDGKREAVEVKFSEAPSLALSILGSQCVEKPTVTDAVLFQCRVRETATNKVTIKNDGNDTWTLYPTIDNPVWSGPETLVVRARESADYLITYAPQVCTKNRADAANDSGTVFFPLPNGTALLYRLDGSSDAPGMAAPAIERDVVAKVHHIEKLTVSNWLKMPQRFVVSMKWSHDPSDDSIVIKGVPSIDIPPDSKRDYKIHFSSYREGKISGTVHFTNEETKEYQFYNITFNVKAAKEVAAIDMHTIARQRKLHEISLTNPLNKVLTLVVKSDNADLIVPASVAMQPKAAVKVPLEFFPLVVREYPPTKLILSCPELGEFPYTVSLSVAPPPPEKPLRVQCALGQLVSTTLRFVHFSKVPTDFSFKFADPKQTSFFKSNGQPVIKVNPCTDLRSGQEVAVDVTFEPSRVGDFKENVEICSTTAGRCMPSHCTVRARAPQRQGPDRYSSKPNRSDRLQERLRRKCYICFLNRLAAICCDKNIRSHSFKEVDDDRRAIQA